MGGRWTLRDIVDYELIATMALLETAADRREALMRQIYEVNRETIDNGMRILDDGHGRNLSQRRFAGFSGLAHRVLDEGVEFPNLHCLDPCL